MDLVDLNDHNLGVMIAEQNVEILVDLVDLNLTKQPYESDYMCRDPCGSRGSKFTITEIIQK